MAEWRNIVPKIKGSKLILEIDLDKPIGPTKSGRHMGIATTQGDIQVLSKGLTGELTGIRLGLNLYRPFREDEK